MSYRPDPEFQKLYSIFTTDPQSIGAHLNNRMAHLSKNDPLLVATGSDVVIFPGGGREPLAESFRTSTRGFIELTSISHLGVAIPYIIRLRELGDPGWESDAQRLVEQTTKIRETNTEKYWRETVAVEAWAGLEAKIADLVDYSCDVTLDYMARAKVNPEHLSFAYLRDNFLDPLDSSGVPVPMNDMMAATFALVLLDSSFRIIRWLRTQDFDWERMMVMICGRAGRPTAGLTWQTNTMCHLLWQASRQKLPPDRLYIAPHAPGLVLSALSDAEGRAAIEEQFRQIWFSSRATVEVGRLMYEGYPAYRPVINNAPVVDDATRSVSELPIVRSPDDRRAIITRLRIVMEDPGQQLANAAAQYMIDQLCATDNNPRSVFIPGFTNTTYPRRTPCI